jgi:hypothetical protein
MSHEAEQVELQLKRTLGAMRSSVISSVDNLRQRREEAVRAQQQAQQVSQIQQVHHSSPLSAFLRLLGFSR